MFGIDDIVGAMIFSALASAVASTVVGAVGSGVNAKVQSDINDENLAYAQGMTEEQWRRDDSSLQRQVADAKKAGLSPLAVTGAMNSSSPLNYQAQAPQMDLASLIAGISSFDNVTNTLQKKAELKQSDEQLDKNLVHDLYKFNAQLENEKDYQDNSLKQDLVKFNKEMIYQYDVLNSQNEQFSKGQDLDRLQSISNTSLKQYEQICASLGVAPNTKEYSDYGDYLEAKRNFDAAYLRTANARSLSGISDKTSFSNSEGAKLGSSVLSTGVNFSNENASSLSVDTTKTNSFSLLMEAINKYPFPIFVIPEGEDIEKYSYEDAKVK